MMRLDERTRLIWEPVTLDGEPARIIGRRNRHATVVTATGVHFEWSWEAARRIVNRGGAFHS